MHRRGAFAVRAGALLFIGAGAASAVGPDIKLCRLYDLRQFGRELNGGVYQVGLAAATRSWNVGTANVNWWSSPDSRHPFIALNVYRLLNGRFEQIGLNFVKHGFYAESDISCGGTGSCAGDSTGRTLGVGCDDLYGASLNSFQNYLGPRFEINPWTGGWNYTTSIFNGSPPVTSTVERRLRIRESDLTVFSATSNPTGVMYFLEGYYIAADDVNIWNSGAWKPITGMAFNATSSTWTFTVSNSTVLPNEGFAIDAWTAQQGARQTLVAQELPVVENVAQNPMEDWSPDGRAIVASRVTPNTNGTFHFEYAVFNIDMDRQIGSFSVPVPCGVCVSNIGFSAVPHFTEPTNSVGGKAIDNTPWVGTRTYSAVEWRTPRIEQPEPSNPIRWGMLFNFRFDASTDKVDGLVELGLFKPPPAGGPTAILGLTDVPGSAPVCAGDANCNCLVNFGDIVEILAGFGSVYTLGTSGFGDSNGDGLVDFTDVIYTLAHFNQDCLP